MSSVEQGWRQPAGSTIGLRHRLWWLAALAKLCSKPTAVLQASAASCLSCRFAHALLQAAWLLNSRRACELLLWLSMPACATAFAILHKPNANLLWVSTHSCSLELCGPGQEAAKLCFKPASSPASKRSSLLFCALISSSCLHILCLQLREPGQEAAYRIPFAVRRKKHIQKNGRYFITLYDHHTGRPLKLEDFEAQV